MRPAPLPRPSLLFTALLLAGLCVHAGEGRPGVLKFSNGQELTGEIKFTGDPLRIFEGNHDAKGKYINVSFDELAGLTYEPLSQTMEKRWRFKEAGSDEKEYLPGEYPLLKLRGTIKLKTGRAISGQIMNKPVYVNVTNPNDPTDQETQKYHLRCQLEGEVPQKLTDLVYVSEIRFNDMDPAQPATGNGTLSGQLTLPGRIEKVAAYGFKRGRDYEGKVEAKGAYKISDLVPDTYALIVLTDRAIYAGLTDTPTDANTRPLQKEDLDDLRKTLAKFEDYFDVQEAWALQGSRDLAHVFVHQKRTKPSVGGPELGTKELHRLDLWRWNKGDAEWRIELRGRSNLFRYLEEKNGPHREFKPVQELARVEIDPAKQAQVKLDYKSE